MLVSFLSLSVQCWRFWYEMCTTVLLPTRNMH